MGAQGVRDMPSIPELEEYHGPLPYNPASIRKEGLATRPADPVDNPDHYKRFKIEPWFFITENELPFWCGSVIKYVMRYDAKDGLQDLKKARRVLDMFIKKLEGDKEWWR